MSSDKDAIAKDEEIWRFRIGVDDNGAIISLATSSTIWYFREPISFEVLVEKYKNVLEVLDNITFDSSDVIKRIRKSPSPELIEQPRPPMTYIQLRNEAKRMLLWMYRIGDVIFGAENVVNICGLKKQQVFTHLSKLTREGVLERVSRGAYQKVASELSEEAWAAKAFKKMYVS